ncbi:MAG: ABC transporter permease [Flavisolibacter sp.]
MFEEESQLASLYKMFAGIALFISCLRLYGLVSFMALHRTKEVGIRKVLGATVTNIIYLFSEEFSLLLIVAFILAARIAYCMMNNWLQNFVFRIQMEGWTFLLALFCPC